MEQPQDLLAGMTLSSTSSLLLWIILCWVALRRKQEAHLWEVLLGTTAREKGALLHLEDLFQDIFQDPKGTAPLEMHMPVLDPSHLNSVLELKHLTKTCLS